MTKKIISLLLSILMLTSVTAGLSFNAKAADPNTNTFTKGYTFDWGFYPQAKVTNTATINALNGIDAEMYSFGYCYKRNGNEVQGYINMKCSDICYNGELYRKVTFGEYPCYRLLSESSTNEELFHQYNNNYRQNNTYYFKWAPIKWKVIGVDSDGVLIQSLYSIDSQPYDASCMNTTWGSSSLRSLLNNDFYNSAFSDSEKNVIKSTSLTTRYIDYDAYESSVTDNVFILDYSDLTNTNYFTSAAVDANRASSGPTDYAKCQGFSSDSGANNYWMRSGGYYNNKQAGYVNGSGTVGTGNKYSKDYTFIGVRPALKLKKNTTINITDTTDNINSLTYEIKVNTNDPAGCNVSGGGRYARHKAILKADVLPGYDFLGWSKNSASTTYVSTENTISVGLFSNLSTTTFYANVAKSKYKLYVTKEPDVGALQYGGLITAYPIDVTVEWGKTVSLNMQSINDYVFLGWYDNNGNLKSSSVSYSFTMPKNAVSLVAKLKPKRKDVTVKAETGGKVSVDGGEDTGETVASFTNDTSHTLKATADSDYKFDGWYDEADKKVSDAETYTFNYDTAGSGVYTAKFSKKTSEEPANPENPETEEPITELTEGATKEQVEKFITSLPNDNDPAGTTFSFMLAKMAKVKKTSIKLTWKANDDAASYVVYGNKCGKKNK